MTGSKLEQDFLRAWQKSHPRKKPEQQYRWHPTRKYRADFAFVEERVLVEIMGTRSHKSAHTSILGYHKDCVRMAIAQALGWRIIYIDSVFDRDWREAVKLVEDVVYGNQV